jgi:hypothetical protein
MPRPPQPQKIDNRPSLWVIAVEIAVPCGVPSTFRYLIVGTSFANFDHRDGPIATPVNCGASWITSGTSTACPIRR